MDTGIKKLLGFLMQGGEECEEFFSIAMASFFEDIVHNDECISIQEIRDDVGGEIFDRLYPCALEFFFSNAYPMPDSSDGSWNIIDVFLKKKGKALSAKERSYLEGMRDSYMSVYEIIAIKPDESLTVRDMIQGGAPITVSEKLATRSLVTWDRIGARLVKEAGRTVLAGGILVLPHDAASEAVSSIKALSALMKKTMTARALKSYGLTVQESEQLQKKLWVKEIALIWAESQSQGLPDLVNGDDDPLQFCTITFFVKGKKQEVVRLLNALPELKEDAPEGKEDYAWLWPVLVKKGKKKKLPQGKAICMETQVENLQDKKLYNVFAQVAIIKKKLIVHVNSSQRANILHDYITSHLGSLVDEGVIHKEDMEKLKAAGKSCPSRSKPTQSKAPTEEETAFLLRAKESYYRDWLDMEIPALGNKTPRQAVKTSTGREKVIDLLKYMQNSELKQSKNDPSGTPYDFSWMWKELNLAS